MPTSARRRPAKRKRLPGRPVGSDGEAARRAIVEAGLVAFAARGYEAMSVRDLARELGVSHNLIHHHYGSKAALWRAALEHGFGPSAAELVSLVERSGRNSDWDTAVRESIQGAIRLLARHPQVTAILVQESARGGARLDFLFDRYMKPFADLLARLLGSPGGKLTGRIDPRAALLFLFAGMTALFAHGGLVSKLGGPAPTSEKDLAVYAESVAALIAHGLTAPGQSATRVRRAATLRGIK